MKTRNAAQAPLSANATAPTSAAPLSIAIAPIPAAETAAVVPVAPSMLSSRLKALQSPATQIMLTGRLIRSLDAISQSIPWVQRTNPAASWRPKRRPGPSSTAVVDRADGGEQQGEGDHRGNLGPGFADDRGGDEKRGDDAGAAEVGGRPAVLFVVDRVVEEAGRERDPTSSRHGQQRQAPREGQSEDRAKLLGHGQTASASSSTARLNSMISAIASSIVCCERQPVSVLEP